MQRRRARSIPAISTFGNIEYPIPASLVYDAQGQAKTQFVVRLAATEGTLNPGLYYLRLMKDYDSHASQVAPTRQTTVTIDSIQQQVIAWDMPKCLATITP